MSKAFNCSDCDYQFQSDWYQLKIAKINETFGIGFGGGTGNEEE